MSKAKADEITALEWDINLICKEGHTCYIKVFKGLPSDKQKEFLHLESGMGDIALRKPMISSIMLRPVKSEMRIL
jgi:hypothetical protein